MSAARPGLLIAVVLAASAAMPSLTVASGWRDLGAGELEREGSTVPTGCAISPGGTLRSSVRVPDLVGSTFDEASIALASLGLLRDDAEQPPSARAVVVSQRPGAGEAVVTGSVVALHFVTAARARGHLLGVTTMNLRRPESVPDLSGLSIEQAAAAAAVRSLRLAAENGDRGRVLDQDPSAGALMPPGSTIRVTLRRSGSLVRVPDAVGLDLRSAEDRVENAGLILRAHGVRAGRVEFQQPVPGTLAWSGALVGVQVTQPATGEQTDTIVGGVALVGVTAIVTVALWRPQRRRPLRHL